MHILHKPSEHEHQVRTLVSEAFEMLLTRANPDDVRIVRDALQFLNDFSPKTYRALLGNYLLNDIFTTINVVTGERKAA